MEIVGVILHITRYKELDCIHLYHPKQWGIYIFTIITAYTVSQTHESLT